MKSSPKDKERHDTSGSGRLAALSLCLNTSLTALKYLLFLLTGSYAILAETVHSLTDVIGSVLVVGGVHLSERKTKQFPWGLYKVENLAAVLSAGFIFVSAYEISRRVIGSPVSEIRNLDLALTGLFLMAVPVLLFARYEAKKARAINSPALIADAAHWKSDVAPLAVVAVGITGTWLSYRIMDKLAAATVLFLVVKAGYGILKNSMKSILDASVDRPTLNEIEDVVKGFPQVREVAALHARNSGRYIFVHLDLRLSLKRLKDAHNISDEIEKMVKERVPFVERVIIHYEPEVKGYKRFAVGLENREGMLSEHFGGAPFIALWDKRTGDPAITNREVLENPFKDMEKGKGIKLAEMLVEKGADIIYTKEDFTGKGPEYVLSDAEVEVRKTDLKAIDDLIGKEV